ncbi:capsular biosynthesis protein [Vibrio nereis]|uniref:capsular biosynthesis protein n=1 Tax=Vibrio nereis TaxID=693 RepID=UPI0024952A17|nr:capsular biosynthesis protein [Vibrio nereis]
MFLIMSAAYIDQELQSEFGRIPPSFLPLGNRRLFLHQIKLAPKGYKVYLSLPESYQISKTDKKLLESHNVEVVKLPDELSLGQSLISALNLSEHKFNSPVHVLFGDTLFTKLPEGENFASLSKVDKSYHWAVVKNNEANIDWVREGSRSLNVDNCEIVNGYFNFSKPRELIRSLTKTNWDFLDGLNHYKKNSNFRGEYSDDWLDFGHVNTYYSSKAHFTTQRAFNELKIASSYIEKSSSRDIKIAAEANWFFSIPYSIRYYTPQYLGSNHHDGRTSYKLEYLHNTALNELYVFSELPNKVWSHIIDECIEFLKACTEEKAPDEVPKNNLEELFVTKTSVRLAEYCKGRRISLDQEWSYNGDKVTLNELLSLSNENLPSDSNTQTLLHGDFCFSNILYDFRSNRIKAIDPRGITPEGEFSIYGNVYYDIAKLAHSIIGLYDWIIAGYYFVNIEDKCIELEIDNNDLQEVQSYFVDRVYQEFSITEPQLIAMQIQLFLSMLPLHSDDISRQDALFSNAFRLYEKLKNIL